MIREQEKRERLKLRRRGKSPGGPQNHTVQPRRARTADAAARKKVKTSKKREEDELTSGSTSNEEGKVSYQESGDTSESEEEEEEDDPGERTSTRVQAKKGHKSPAKVHTLPHCVVRLCQEPMLVPVPVKMARMSPLKKVLEGPLEGSRFPASRKAELRRGRESAPRRAFRLCATFRLLDHPEGRLDEHELKMKRNYEISNRNFAMLRDMLRPPCATPTKSSRSWPAFRCGMLRRRASPTR
ncbi:hypothetical protein SKAU_G00280080 [Synaphobranchus kaupii]|uniref:Uncharacterized protein n=1 Tax=Synaphobranchus kaupii TaxID=118154 RepID=A0A9Q1EWX6_SYNKA|nr:hypothetical protein SKAU_G00280080 [Synaphobranchus kaupii]